MKTLVIELAPNHKRGLILPNPVMNASGVLGFAGLAAYRGLIDFARLGAFVTNAITFAPRTPAHPPNVLPLPNGVLVHTGLPNPGVGAALQRYAKEWERLGPPVIVHLAATTPVDVQRSVERLDRAEGVSGIELGLRDDVSIEAMARLIRAAWGGPPLIVRLPLWRAAELCEAAARAGADALTVGAPPRASHLVPLPAGAAPGGEGEQSEGVVTGRLYGPENFPAVLDAVRDVAARELGLPLIGAGGIFSIENAQALLAAGAAAVQVDVAVWNDPGLLHRSVRSLG